MPPSTTRDDLVEWVQPAAPCGDRCVLCGNQAANRVIMRAMHPTPDVGWLDVASCDRCGSAWFPAITDAVTEYPSLDEVDPVHFEPFIRHYLELAAGIDWKIAIAERLPYERFGSMLEVGCNAGAFLDYGRLVWGAEVVGLEPSAYGPGGAAALDLPISATLMADTPELRGTTFDFVCAIEVLEHVADPALFLSEMRGFMAPGGVAMITTPGAHALDPTTMRGELLAALSPGAHRFIASQQHLQAMIDEAGFEWSHIEPFGMTQVAYLADRPVDLAASEAEGPVEQRRRIYYERAVARALGDPRQRLGDRINSYTTDRALGGTGTATAEHEIESSLASEFGIDLDELDSLLDHQRTVGTLGAWGERMPYNLPDYLFWRGQRDDLDEARRTTVWEAAALLAAHGLRCDPVNLFLYVDVLRPAVHALGGRRDGGRRAEIVALLEQIPEGAGLSIPAPATVDVVRSVLASARRRITMRR